MERIKDRIQNLSDHVENVGRLGNSEDIKRVSDLVDGVRSAVVDCQVRNRSRTRLTI